MHSIKKPPDPGHARGEQVQRIMIRSEYIRIERIMRRNIPQLPTVKAPGENGRNHPQDQRHHNQLKNAKDEEQGQYLQADFKAK